jgi:hypothetical protein
MRLTLLAACAATLFLLAPALAQPADLSGELRGSMTTRADGTVRVTDRDGHQTVRFHGDFEVSREAGAEVRHIGRNGRVTTLGTLQSKEGSQAYPVPSPLTVGKDDHIVIYSPRYDEDLATVQLSEK